MPVFIVLLIIFILAVVYILFQYKIYNYWKKKNVIYMKPNFIFGNIWEVLSLRSSWSNFVYHVQTNYNDYPYVGIFVMWKPALVVCNLEIIKNILIRDFDYFADNWFQGDPKVDPVVGVNPFVLKGNKWRDTRNMFTSQFTPSMMKSLCPLLENVCENMVQFIKTNLETQNTSCLDLVDLTARFTGDAVMCCGFGLEGNSFMYKTPEVFKIAGTSADTPGKVNTLKHTLGLFSSVICKIFKITFYGDPVPQRFYDIILDAVDNREHNKIQRSDLLNHFIQLKNCKKIENTELIGHAFTFFLDGFQTSYAALSYALVELSLNRDIQNTARDHVKNVLLKYDGKFSFDAYNELDYIKNVVHETLRKYPIIATMGKVCTQNYHVQDPDNGISFTIEKGTIVYWSLKAIHHNPKYYPHPDKFDPDRFTKEVLQTRPKYSFLGFGDGPRICIGRKFALMQVVFALSAILLNFELQFSNKTALPIVHDSFHLFDVPDKELFVDFVQIPKNDDT